MSTYTKEYGRNILIYDCCSEELMQLIAALENQFDITCAIDGDDCLDLALMVQPDILLIDDMAIGPSCYEICHTLKGSVQTQDITILLLSDLFPDELETEVPLVGADDYVCRPINCTELIDNIKQLLCDNLIYKGCMEPIAC